MARQTIPNSGLWSAIAGLFNANFTELYEHEQFGVYDYNDAGTASSPINITLADTWYALTNDGAGQFTNKTYALSTVPDVWDTASNSFDFTGLALGDTVDIRLDITVTSGSLNQDFDIALFIADGQPGEYQIPFIVEQSFKAAGSRQVIRFNSIYIGDSSTRDNPARFKIRSSDPGSVVVNGWYVRANKRKI